MPQHETRDQLHDLQIAIDNEENEEYLAQLLEEKEQCLERLSEEEQ
jgi:hypothetical protein